MKTCHLATKLNANGAASALCFAKPRAINMKVATWTTDSAAVTCEKCIDELEHQATHEPFWRRAVKRMHERGLITTEGHDRMLDSSEPTEMAQECGMLQALLCIALWPMDESVNEGTTP